MSIDGQEISEDMLTQLSVDHGASNSTLFHTEIPYTIYENKNPFLRQYDKDFYDSTEFS